MPNLLPLAVGPSPKDQLPTRGLLLTALWRGVQSEGSSFTKVHFKRLKKVSGRLTRFLLGRDKLVSKEPAILHLLVVDDEEAICFSMKEYFSHSGFLVDTAHELEEAERLIENGHYEVVIQDLRLGVTKNPDGLEMIRLVHRRNPETRIVVLTAYGSTEVESEARRSGADAFLRKPQPLSQVAQVVRGLMESPRKPAAPYA